MAGCTTSSMCHPPRTRLSRALGRNRTGPILPARPALTGRAARPWPGSSPQSDGRLQALGARRARSNSDKLVRPFRASFRMLTGRTREDAPNPIALPDFMHRIAVLLALLGGTLAAGPALAQLGAIFGDSPPRPPANVPNGSFPPQPPPVQYPPQSLPPPPAQYPAQSSAPPVQYPAQASPPPAVAGPPPSGIQTQPLPPPPGATSAPSGPLTAVAPPMEPLDSSNQPVLPQPSPSSRACALRREPIRRRCNRRTPHRSPTTP